MVSTTPTGNGRLDPKPDVRLPPTAELAIATMLLVIVGAIFVVGYMPRQAPLWIPITTIVAAAAIMIVNVYLLSQVKSFAWRTFFIVGRYALLAYIVIAGMLEFVFVFDDTPGTTLILLTLMLIIYAVDIPLLFAFSVARYQPPEA
ncbi:MAG TPA: hypothetical protein VHA53_09690 [Nitrolancea sp.]|nr:hypothetical protein [Nitrolancea sp.]